jgi:hypothetical protein
MSKMMKRGIFMFLLLLAVSIGIIYYTIDLESKLYRLLIVYLYYWQS